MQITTLEVAGFESALTGMRNPMNSWDKRDSKYLRYDDGRPVYSRFIIGDNDLKLAQSLIKGGSEHRKFLRQIQVWADFDMPRYWWSEFDTYKIGTTANSCSTMHKLLNNTQPITIDMFAYCKEDLDVLEVALNRLEYLRQEYLKTKDDYLLIRAKRLLAEGFLQLRTVNLNYETIYNMYHQRENHRLKKEWQDVFCGWVKSLPNSKELIIN